MGEDMSAPRKLWVGLKISDQSYASHFHLHFRKARVQIKSPQWRHSY